MNFAFILRMLASALFIVFAACGPDDLVVANEEASFEEAEVLSDEEAATIESELTYAPVPSGFYLVASGTGFRMYRKDYAGGAPDYVTVVDLRAGSIRSISGTVSGAPNGVVGRKWLKDFWSQGTSQNTTSRKLRVLVNAAFFSTNDNPAAIAFGLKKSGTVVNYGYGLKEYPNHNKVLLMTGNHVWMEPYSKSYFDSASIPNVIGGLDPGANKSASTFTGRTFVGIRDTNGDGATETLIAFSSSYARQVDATNVLKGFGAIRYLMLDGGGSTGLVLDNKNIIAPGRTVPHVLGFYSGR